ncbi:hypothetical protein BELL_0083g00140 [Botrytis elliptica]|uniref:Uncharacterized protein n=1 Tax=Botrytis elliptica TaxID=278938 RepID=A0A4Z1K217_9HELO|nr:hypothetical protein EAE99_012189 [Botrytis elliptica]TGO77990.1 hypothetical protein BELL_0083g00140 [Botrytis elliptica]
MFGTRALSQALVVELSISITWVTMTFVMQPANVILDSLATVAAFVRTRNLAEWNGDLSSRLSML